MAFEGAKWLVNNATPSIKMSSPFTSNVVNYAGNGLLSCSVAKLLDKESRIKILRTMTEKVEERQ